MDDLSVYRQCDLLYNQEKLSRYRPGGYHPVRLGDTFKDSRYEVHHKLGWGSSSTVWLADDRMYAIAKCEKTIQPLLTCYSRNRWVSIKILAADRSGTAHELRNLQSLAERGRGSLCSKYIVHLQDTFLHQGPNGRHRCLVFELLGPSVDAVLRNYSDDGETLMAETVLKMSRQLLQAIASIHEAGYAHGGMVE